MNSIHETVTPLCAPPHCITPGFTFSEACPRNLRPFFFGYLRLWACCVALATGVIAMLVFSPGTEMPPQMTAFDVIFSGICVSGAIFGWCLGMHIVFAGYVLMRREGATVRVNDPLIEIARGVRPSQKYRLSECSWYEATPRHDTGIQNAWAFVFPCASTIIIEFPGRQTFLGFAYCNERVAVGWCDQTYEQWRSILTASEVPMGMGHRAMVNTLA